MPDDLLQLAILHHLSCLVVRPHDIDPSETDFVLGLAEQKQQELFNLCGMHRVLLRVLQVLGSHESTSSKPLPDWLSVALFAEQQKSQRSMAMLALVCNELSAAGYPLVVIKSLDHWPDLGSDFDIYAKGPASDIRKLMQQEFEARSEVQSWSDRLSDKWRFEIPGIDKSIEIHLGGLGQTGQQCRMGRLTLARKMTRRFQVHELPVPSPEDQILIRAIDRCYRHYSFRLCDIIDTAHVIRSNTIDFDYLKSESKRAGVRKGVCSFLAIVDDYYSHYANDHLLLPQWVRNGASFREHNIYAHAGLLRIPLFPQAARLYRYELTKALRRKDIRKAVRTGLIPPLAVAAAARFRITGRDKGIW